jgi:hypothetical protein
MFANFVRQTQFGLDFETGFGKSGLKPAFSLKSKATCSKTKVLEQVAYIPLKMTYPRAFQ